MSSLIFHVCTGAFSQNSIRRLKERTVKIIVVMPYNFMYAFIPVLTLNGQHFILLHRKTSFNQFLIYLKIITV